MKRIIASVVTLWLVNISCSAGMATAAVGVAGRQEQAVVLARQGQYDEALAQLDQLGANSPAVLWDKIVILGWAGRHDQAVAVFEALPAGKLPDYLKLSAAGSYYRVGRFAEAARLYHAVAQGGSRQARRWEAESLMRQGAEAQAGALYTQLLAENPKDVDSYVSRGTMRLLTANIAGGVDDLEQAIDLTEDAKQRLTLRAQIAGACIRAGEYIKAIVQLKPYIDEGTATRGMQGDYVLALRLNGEYAAAATAGRRLWPVLQDGPVYGVQAMADSCLRLNQPKAAIELYNHLLARGGEDLKLRDLLAGVAYATMLDGQVAQSKQLYGRLLETFPQTAEVVAGDAAALMDLGRYWSGKELFKLVIAKDPNNRQIRQQFATVLAAHRMPREAASEYAALAALPGGQPVAGAGLVAAGVNAGDYQIARQGLQGLMGQRTELPVVGQAEKKFEQRPQGNLSAGGASQYDHKDIAVTDMWVAGEQRVGDRTTALATVDNKKVSQAGATARYHMLGAGVQYIDQQQSAVGLWNVYGGAIRTNAYQGRYTRYFGDQTKWTVSGGRAPVDQPLAIRSGIMQTSQRLGFERELGRKDAYSLGMTRATYSDGNHSFGYDGRWTHAYSYKHNILRQWFVYFSRNGFAYQSFNGVATTYESPSLRESYGIGVRQHWDRGRTYWENTVVLDWNRDHPENFSLGPYTRLEFGLPFSAAHRLVLGAEFGTRTVHDGGGLWFGYRKYDINYQQSW